MTKSQLVAADVAALLRARNPLLWIVSREEARVERYLIEAAAAASYIPRTWDIANGAQSVDGKNKISDTNDPRQVLREIEQRSQAEQAKAERGVWFLRDLPVWIGAGPAGAEAQRIVRNLARSLPGVPRFAAQALVVISPSGEVPAELAGHATVIEWPLPDRAEIAATLEATIASLPETDERTGEPIRSAAAPNGTRDAAIDAAVGLTQEEAQACYAKSLVLTRKIDPVAVAQEKKRVIARERVLEWFDPLPGGLDAVGGLDVLKGWLTTRKTAYSPAARAYGLPAPKGVFVIGVSGCGKSMTAKAVPVAWGGIPLLRLDLGALKSKFVGESEQNLRKAFEVIKAIGRCVVWIDEVEKALQGATSGSADGGVSSDALGAILNWMQERQGEAFVIATANNVDALPPEFLRKGRFDEVFFVDLPNSAERAQVLLSALKAHGRKSDVLKDTTELVSVVQACDGFTGSEIAAIVPDALYAAFADGAREITANDLMIAAKAVVPLSKTAGSKIKTQREWAEGKARKATSPLTSENAPAGISGRALDL